jgi:hypothetical protein
MGTAAGRNQGSTDNALPNRDGKEVDAARVAASDMDLS